MATVSYHIAALFFESVTLLARLTSRLGCRSFSATFSWSPSSQHGCYNPLDFSSQDAPHTVSSLNMGRAGSHI